MEQQQQLPNGEVEASPRASPAWGGALKAGSAPGAGSLCQILTQQQQPPPPLQQARAPMAMPFKQASPVMAGAPRVPRVALVDAAIDDPVPLSLDGNGPTRAVSLLDFVSRKPGKASAPPTPPSHPKAAWGGAAAAAAAAGSPRAAGPATADGPSPPSRAIPLADILAQQAYEEAQREKERAMLLATAPGAGGKWGALGGGSTSLLGGSAAPPTSQRWGLLPETRAASMEQIQFEEVWSKLEAQQVAAHSPAEPPPAVDTGMAARRREPAGDAASGDGRRQGDRRKKSSAAPATPTTVPHTSAAARRTEGSRAGGGRNRDASLAPSPQDAHAHAHAPQRLAVEKAARGNDKRAPTSGHSSRTPREQPRVGAPKKDGESSAAAVGDTDAEAISSPRHRGRSRRHGGVKQSQGAEASCAGAGQPHAVSSGAGGA